jgi:PEGA domain
MKTAVYCLETLSLLFLLSVVASVFPGCNSDKFSLQVFGTRETIGATVLIDGKEVGIMKPFSDHNDSRFSIWLSAGTHTIEIRKEGYASFKREVTTRPGESEYYLDANLIKQ